MNEIGDSTIGSAYASYKGLVATVGLGMLLCLVFYYTATGKGGPSPILMFAYTFSFTYLVLFSASISRDALLAIGKRSERDCNPAVKAGKE